VAPVSDETLAPVREAAVRVAASHGLEIFDLQFRRESIGWVLRVMVDRVSPKGAPGTAAPPGTP
jgi:ribosome maturation factor RimP